MRISDWSSDVCSSDLGATLLAVDQGQVTLLDPAAPVVIRHGQQAQLQAGAVQPLMPTGLDPWAWVDGVISANGTRLGDFLAELDRKSVVLGKSVSVRLDLGGRRIIKKKTNNPY